MQLAQNSIENKLMGIVCEFYIVKDKIIEDFLANPIEFEDYFTENYINVFGQFHNEEENMFYCDKAWDIAQFLFQQNSASLDELLGKAIENTERKSYIKSKEAKRINEILSQITLHQIEKAYDKTKIQKSDIYNAEKFTKDENWDYILEHIKTFFKAFKKATESDAGIIISRG